MNKWLEKQNQEYHISLLKSHLLSISECNPNALKVQSQLAPRHVLSLPYGFLQQCLTPVGKQTARSKSKH